MNAKMDNLKITRLNIEALERARKSLRRRLLPDGEPLKLEQRIDVLPSPQSEGDVIFGESGREYQAAFTDGTLQWWVTGKSLVDYWESDPSAVVIHSGGLEYDER